MSIRRRIAEKIDDLKYERELRQEERAKERQMRKDYFAETLRLRDMSESEKLERTQRIQRFIGRVAIVPNLYHILKYEDERAYEVRDGIAEAILSEFPADVDTFTVQTIIGQRQGDRFQQFALCRERLRETLRNKAPERNPDTQDVYKNTVISPRGFGWLALSDALGEIEKNSLHPDRHGLVAIMSGLELPLSHPEFATEMRPGSVAILENMDDTGSDVWRKIYGKDPYAHLTSN